jgi:hypothetical protein
MQEPSVTALLQQGLTAARVGDVADARRLLRQATQISPDHVEAWLALAGVVETLEEKKRCFATVLELEPAHSEAKAGLELVEQKLAESRASLNSGIGYCYRHPEVETGLRCNRCNKLICPKCAHRTPVGFRCPDCIREQEDKFYSGSNFDYVVAALVTLPLAFIAALLLTRLLQGFFFILIGFFIIPAVAGFIAEIVRWAVGKRRSRYLGRVTAGALIVATLPFVLIALLGGSIFSLIGPGLFIFLGVSTILARLR